MKMEQGLEVYSSSKNSEEQKATSVSDKPNDAEVQKITNELQLQLLFQFQIQERQC